MADLTEKEIEHLRKRAEYFEDRMDPLKCEPSDVIRALEEIERRRAIEYAEVQGALTMRGAAEAADIAEAAAGG